jgi:shikimate dehydrogenase
MKVFGLIGFPLTHSFSAEYFNNKFRKLNLSDNIFKAFPIQNISELSKIVLSEAGLSGLSVTIPFKEQVIPYLNDLSPEAREIGAVNCIKLRNGRLSGFNTDCYGFEKAYIKQIADKTSEVLILGNGGASKAVQYVLHKNNIPFHIVSRSASAGIINYGELTNQTIRSCKVIINTTPLGMFPDVENCPPLNYRELTTEHLLIDLIYNPEYSKFLQYGQKNSCRVFNGLSMLHHQADQAWNIWNG